MTERRRAPARAPKGGRARAASAESAALARLRKLCLALPGTTETASWGHPNFRTKRIYAAFESYGGKTCICLGVGPVLQEQVLRDPRYARAPYTGNKGWVMLPLDAGVDWKELAALLRESHRLASEPATRPPVPRRRAADER